MVSRWTVQCYFLLRRAGTNSPTLSSLARNEGLVGLGKKSEPGTWDREEAPFAIALSGIGPMLNPLLMCDYSVANIGQLDDSVLVWASLGAFRSRRLYPQ